MELPIFIVVLGVVMAILAFAILHWDKKTATK